LIQSTGRLSKAGSPAHQPLSKKQTKEQPNGQRMVPQGDFLVIEHLAFAASPGHEFVQVHGPLGVLALAEFILRRFGRATVQ
jgi:hypothetical protein